MEKDDLIKYWKSESLRDWKRVDLLIKNKDYVFALFCAHLSLEKLLKSHWIKDNESNHPPKIHNLVYLISKTKLQPSVADIKFLEQINTFQIEGRYPDYRSNLYRKIRAKQCLPIIDKVKTTRQWLIKNL